MCTRTLPLSTRAVVTQHPHGGYRPGAGAGVGQAGYTPGIPRLIPRIPAVTTVTITINVQSNIDGI